jgi:hypothetical protein
MSRQKTTEEFVKQCHQKFGDRFDYSFTIYVRNNDKVEIRCCQHNLKFFQTPSNHLLFDGCPKCFEEKQRERFQKSTENFIRDARLRHGMKYDYSQTIYVNNHTPITVICHEHGPFQVTPINHLKASGVDCQKCGFMKLPGSYFNKYFKRHPENKNKPSTLYFVQFTDNTTKFSFYKLGVTTQNIEQRFAAPQYSKFTITLIWKSDGPLIVTCGLERHLKRIFSVVRTKASYKFHGSTECFTEAIPCCFIPEKIDLQNLTYDLDLMLSRILIKSGICEYRWQARRLRIDDVPADKANKFFIEHHIQGTCSQAIRTIGLWDDDKLLCAMSVGHPRYKKDCDFELIRFATKKFSIVIGGASRLFKHFINTQHPQTVVSYSDRMWNEGKVYIILGFKKTHSTSPNYWYVKNDIRLSRIKCQKHKLFCLLGEDFNPAKSESENMFAAGYHKIFDSGQDVFVWTANP